MTERISLAEAIAIALCKAVDDDGKLLALKLPIEHLQHAADALKKHLPQFGYQLLSEKELEDMEDSARTRYTLP